MRFEMRHSYVAAALLYAAAALFSAISLWLVLSSALHLDVENRNHVLFEMRMVLLAWVLVCGAGIVLSALALRFSVLSIWRRRAMLAMSFVVAALAGFWLEWWQSLNFLLPAAILAVTLRGTVHA